MRASLLQIDVKPDEPVEIRRERVAALVRAQAGADLVVLPELWTVGAFAFDAFADHAEPLDGPTAQAMGAAARDAGVWLHAGSIVERAPDGPLYNTSLLFAPDGEPHRAYRKIHRFGFDRGEAALMERGEEIVTARLGPVWSCQLDEGARLGGFGSKAEEGGDVVHRRPTTTRETESPGCASPAGNSRQALGPTGPGVTVGLATCYDLRFPEMFRLLVDAGAEVIIVPAGWPARRRAHWSLLARARAVESQAYVLACGTAGTHAGVEQGGYSVVVDPWGEVVAEAGADEQVLTVELDPARVARTRADFPVLRDRVIRVLGLPTP